MARLNEFSAATRQRNLEALSRDTFDLLIIGGGITGAGIARDATLRGLRVALVEQRDFASGTSSRSSKLVHGGLRYLAQGDVGLVMEAANERRTLRRIAPYLARPLQMLVPVHGRSGYMTISAGLFTYDKMARVEKEHRNQMLGRDDTLAKEPLLRRDKVYGAGFYYECLTDDARLVIENIKTAAALGGIAANYTEVVSFRTEGGRLSGAVVRDRLGGGEFEVRAHVTVNAAGPWVDAVRLLQGESEKPRLHLTKGIHLVVPKERLPVQHCVVMTTPDKRSIFVVPRGDIVYLGTTDTNYEGRLDEPAITVEDGEYLLQTTNATFDIEPLRLSDTVGAWAGLRPLLHQEGKKPSEISRRDEIMVGPSGLLSIAGGKLTAYRRMAERIVENVAEILTERGHSVRPDPGNSATELLSGGATGEDVEAFAARLKSKWSRLPADIVERLVTVYGSNAERMVEGMATDPQLALRCAPESAVTQSEVAYAVREEMVMTLVDFLERRSRLFLWDRANGLGVASQVAHLMAPMLGWDTTRVDRQIREYGEHVAAVKHFVSPESDIVEKKVAHA